MDMQTNPTGSTDAGHRLFERPRDEGMLTGTSAGIAEYLGTDPTVVRVGFVALTLLGGAGVPLYLAAWLLMPEEGGRSIAADLLDRSGIAGVANRV